MCVTLFELAWWYTPSFSILHEKNKRLVKHDGTDLDQHKLPCKFQFTTHSEVTGANYMLIKELVSELLESEALIW